MIQKDGSPERCAQGDENVRAHPMPRPGRGDAAGMSGHHDSYKTAREERECRTNQDIQPYGANREWRSAESDRRALLAGWTSGHANRSGLDLRQPPPIFCPHVHAENLALLPSAAAPSALPTSIRLDVASPSA